MEEEINMKVAEYEENLRKAERDIERALQAICPLRGTSLATINRELGKVLDVVQNHIRGAWELYDNPDIELS